MARPLLVYPVFKSPRKASAYSRSPPKLASDSSSKMVGSSASHVRISAAADIEPVINGLATMSERHSNNRVFPDAGVALVTKMYGVT